MTRIHDTSADSADDLTMLRQCDDLLTRLQPGQPEPSVDYLDQVGPPVRCPDCMERAIRDEDGTITCPRDPDHFRARPGR